jgi:hypothetical protein
VASTLADAIRVGSPGVGEFTFGGLGGRVRVALSGTGNGTDTDTGTAETGTVGCSNGSVIWLRVMSTTLPSLVRGETARTGDITNRGVLAVGLDCTGVAPLKVFSQLTSRSESFEEFSFSQYAIRSLTGAVMSAVLVRSEPRKVCSQLASLS